MDGGDGKRKTEEGEGTAGGEGREVTRVGQEDGEEEETEGGEGKEKEVMGSG